MSHLDRLIAKGTTTNFAAPVIQGLQARGQLDTRDLANTQARNTIERQSNVNRLLQSGAGVDEISRVDPSTAAQIQNLQVSQQSQKNTAKDRLMKSLALTGFASTVAANPDLNIDPSLSVFDNDSPEQLDLQRMFTKQGAGKRVQTSEILPGGAVRMVFTDGTVELKTPEEADEILIKDAEQRGVDLQGQRSQSREVGKGSGKVALQSFEGANKIRKNIANLNEGIRLIRDEGAETGPIAAQLPSMRAASIELDNLRNKLGLDVIGDVTFGALSKGELDLALNTALPTNLEGPELIAWMERKASAQDVLARSLEDAALFLSKPGNDIADLIQRSRDSQQTQAPAAQQAPPDAQTQEEGLGGLSTEELIQMRQGAQ